MPEHPSSDVRPVPECLSIECLRRGAELELTLRGEFDLSGVDAFELALRNVRGSDRVILNMSDLAFLDCSGLRAMLEASRRARAEGWRLVVAEPPPPVVRLLRLAHVESQFELIDRSCGEHFGMARVRAPRGATLGRSVVRTVCRGTDSRA